MIFYDVNKHRSYADFIQQRNTDAPYQGTKDVYPLGARRYSARHWRYREEDGRVEIFYANRKSRDEFEKGKLDERHTPWITKRHLATVYPDDTVEIINTSGQGDNSLLSEAFGVYIHSDSRRGGEVLKNKKGEVHPLFKGQRFKMDSFECLTPYEIFQRRVNRKLAKEAMKPYSEFITIAGVLLDSMDAKGIYDTAQDILENARKKKLIPKENDGWLHGVNALPFHKLDETFFQMIDNKHYVDAAVCFGLCYDVMNARWLLGREDFPTRFDPDYTERFKKNLVKALKQRLSKEVYYQHETFNMRAVEMGEMPASHWTTLVTVGGEPVKRL